MLMNAPATFIQSYIDDLNDALNQLKPGAALTRIQAAWLGTCLVCWPLMNQTEHDLSLQNVFIRFTSRNTKAPAGMLMDKR
ncbi:hypothetical protein [Bathymodiolus japonicus methanotrophic gill symbiont]|uniref:hypothetical protein n=1 Tax=Bathymodiolus japonicus methanotrophic gill symbiont TaxID=113269 RepID=UPI001E2C035B|nr:hypothetical protein [Bathymodiolus japonicus methanotrophic gill symbiont]